jgi:LysW-gamma-L-lysine carboxypeptidase
MTAKLKNLSNEEKVSFLRELVSIPSPSGEEDAVAEYLVGQMAAWDFRARRDEVGNAVGALGDPGAERSIVLLGHMDTVPGHIAVRQEGGRLYGRGAVDAKGPLAAFVLAAAQVAPHLNGTRLLVIGAVEEERHGRGARHLARALPPPYCAIIGEPGGWEGVTLGYKGLLSLDYRLRQPSGHSAGAEQGAAEKAVSFWNQLQTRAQEHNRDQPGRFYTLDPSLRQFNTSSDGLQDEAAMKIALRLPPGLEAEALKQDLRDRCNSAQLEFYPSDPPFQAQKNTVLVRALLRAIRAQGGRPRFKLKTGTSDMNVVGPAWACPIVAYGPGDSSLDHTPREHIKVQEFLRGVEVLAQALHTLAG